MRIGPLPLAAGAALAPMAGVSDASFRLLCARHGAIFTVSEMVSAKALAMGDQKSLRLARPATPGAPYGVQLFGADADTVAEAVAVLAGEAFDFLDLNFGCPAPKIVKNGAGSALLKDPALAGAIAKAAVRASARPVTAKMRIGWDDDTLTGAEVAQRCEDAGITLLVVHARTAKQMYAPGVNRQAVAAIKRAVGIPVLVNGDIESAADALAAVEETGCDGVMIGRGAMGNPFVFREVAAALGGAAPPAAPTLRERMAALEEQVRGMCDEKGEDVAMRQARGAAAAYVRGLQGAAALRREAHSLTRFEDLAAFVRLVYRQQ